MVDFMTQVARVGKHMTTKAQIVDYFQATYTGRGKEGWKQRLIDRLLPFTPQTGKNPRKNLEKRFDPARINNKEPRNKTQYEALGKTLPRLPPERGYHVKGTVCISVGVYPCEERKWDFKVVDTVAADLYQYASLQRLVNVYMGDLPEEEQPQAVLCEPEEGEDENKEDEESDQEQECKSKLKVTALSEKGARHLPNIDQSK